MKKEKVYYIDIPLGYERVMLSHSAKTIADALKEVKDLGNETAWNYANDCYLLEDRIDDAVRGLHEDILLGSMNVVVDENGDVHDYDYDSEVELGKIGVSDVETL